MRAYPKERFSSEVVLTPAMAAAYAHAAGDDNPIHYDADFAAASRFGRPIASSTQTTALLLGLSASQFSKRAQCRAWSYGSGFAARFTPMKPSASNGWW